MFAYFLFIALILCINADEDMTSDNLKLLKSAKKISAEKQWSCSSVKKDMKKNGRTVTDCIIRDGNVWFRIDEGMVWEEAWSACRLIAGSDLASVHNIDEFNYVRYLFWMPEIDRTANWVGLNDLVEEGKYQWSDGSSHDYPKWIMPTKEPNGGKEENCVMYQNQVSGGGCCVADGFVDFKCAFELPAICKLVNPAKE